MHAYREIINMYEFSIYKDRFKSDDNFGAMIAIFLNEQTIKILQI